MANNVTFKINIDSEQAKKSLNQIRKGFESVETIGQAARGPFVALTAALIGVTIPAANFEEQMLNVAKVANLTNDELSDLGDELKDLSFDSKSSATELGKIAFSAGQLGIQGKENILDFTDAVDQISQALGFQAEFTATAMARISKQFNVPIPEIINLGAAINELESSTSASTREIVIALNNLGPVVGRLGFAKEQIAGLAATFIELTGSGEAASVALSRFFSQASSKLDQLAPIIGKSEEELKKLFDSDPTAFFLAIQKGFVNITSSSERTSEAQRIFGIQGAKAVLANSEQLENLIKNLNISQEAYDENVSIQKELARVSTGFNFQMKVLFGQLKLIAIELGTELLPLFKSFISAVGRASKFFISLPDGIKKTIAVMLLAGVAITGLLVSFGLLASAGLTGLKVLKNFAPVLRKLPLLFSPVGLIIAAVIATIVAGFIAWQKNLFGIQEKTKTVLAFIKFGFANLGVFVLSQIQKMIAIFKTFGRILKSAFTGQFSEITSDWKKGTEEITDIAKRASEKMAQNERDFIKTFTEINIKRVEIAKKTEKEKGEIETGEEPPGKIDPPELGEDSRTPAFEAASKKRIKTAQEEEELLRGIREDAGLENLLFLEEQIQLERELDLERLDFQIAQIQGQSEIELDAKRQLETQKEEINQQADKKEVARRKKISEISQTFNLFDLKNLKNFAQAAAGISKNAAKIFQAISLGEAIVSFSRAIVRALAEIPFPASLGAIAGISAVAVPQIATIASQVFQQGGSNLPDDTLGFFNQNEIVIPTSFAEGIRRGDLNLSGPGTQSNNEGGNTFSFDFSGSSFVGANSSVIEEIEQRLTEKLNIVGGTLALGGGF